MGGQHVPLNSECSRKRLEDVRFPVGPNTRRNSAQRNAGCCALPPPASPRSPALTFAEGCVAGLGWPVLPLPVIPHV